MKKINYQLNNNIPAFKNFLGIVVILIIAFILNSQIENLMSKRYTTIDAFEDYKENKISKSDYEKIFKKFTWWIKEEVEKILKMKDNKIEQIESEKLEIIKQSETKQEKITNL